MRRFLPLFLLAALAPVAPADAEIGDPRMSLVWQATDFGDASGRYFVNAACGGVAPGAQLVAVRCVVGGLYADTWTPASVGVATFQGSAVVPYLVCAYGVATYRDGTVVNIVPVCSTHRDEDGSNDALAVLYADINIGRHEVDSRPGQYLPVATPYTVPELADMLCDETPWWLRPCLVGG